MSQIETSLLISQLPRTFDFVYLHHDISGISSPETEVRSGGYGGLLTP